MTTTTQYIGTGLYTIPEVSKLIGMPYPRARAWFAGSNARDPLLTPDFDKVDGDVAVSFLDLIDAHTVNQFRNHGVTMSTIRKAYASLATQLDTPHPFAHAELYVHDRRILIGLTEEVDEPSFQDAINRQSFFREFKDMLKGIQYDSVTKLAERWRITTGVMIDPKVGFGKPAIEGTSTRTHMIAKQYFANNEDADFVAKLYDLTARQVKDAVRFEASIRKQAA